MSLFTRDLHIVLLLTALTLAAVFIPQLNSTPLRVIFGLPFVLFLPGYALIAALFPGKGDLDGIERVALSFGLSIAVYYVELVNYPHTIRFQKMFILK